MGTKMTTVLSSDVAGHWPQIGLKYDVRRSHKETLVHPILKWIKREIEVVDDVRFIGIVVRQAGRTWEIPLSQSSTVEESPAKIEAETTTP
jgi:hypothetical protein